MSGTSTAAKAVQIGLVSSTTPTATPVSPREKTTSMPARTARSIATTEIAAIGQVTAATAGNLWISHNQNCRTNSNCATKARSERKTSTRCAVLAALVCAEEVGGVSRGAQRFVQHRIALFW